MAPLRLVALCLCLVVAAPVEASPVDRWAGHVREASGRFGIPEDWIRRVMKAESGGRTVRHGRPIESRAGAMGLMQLMPGTWRRMRAVHGLGPDPHDPRDNILAGTAYLRAMYDRFGYPGLFAAYNAGPARYADHLATGRTMPKETRDYMARVAGIGPASRPPASPGRPERGSFAPLFAVRNLGARAPGSPVFAPAGRTSDMLFVRLGGAGPAN